jgi:hypothetical protein
VEPVARQRKRLSVAVREHTIDLLVTVVPVKPSSEQKAPGVTLADVIVTVWAGATLAEDMVAVPMRPAAAKHATIPAVICFFTSDSLLLHG